jgi:glycosyltransferase involved in cell wall biosynthesis
VKFGMMQASGEVVVTLDGDGETDPEDLPLCVEALLQGYDFAKGSRLARRRPDRMPFLRWIGNKVLVGAFNILYGTRFTDICSGYNALWRNGFTQLQLTYDGCEMEQQVLAQVLKRGMRVAEVAHTTNGRLGGYSKVSTVRQGLVDLFVILSEWFTD